MWTMCPFCHVKLSHSRYEDGEGVIRCSYCQNALDDPGHPSRKKVSDEVVAPLPPAAAAAAEEPPAEPEPDPEE